MKDIDQRILQELREHARESNLAIAEKLGVSEGTVRKHIASLCDEGVIQKFTVQVKSDTAAIVEVKTAPNISTTQIARHVKALGLPLVLEVAGDYDIICFISAESLEKMNELIEKIRAVKGIVSTQTFPVLKNV